MPPVRRRSIWRTEGTKYWRQYPVGDKGGPGACSFVARADVIARKPLADRQSAADRWRIAISRLLPLVVGPPLKNQDLPFVPRAFASGNVARRHVREGSH